MIRMQQSNRHKSKSREKREMVARTEECGRWWVHSLAAVGGGSAVAVAAAWWWRRRQQRCIGSLVVAMVVATVAATR